MKHRVKGRKFSRLKGPRKALIKTLVGSFIMKEKITTTEAKAKELKPIMDKIISKVFKMKNDETKKVAVIRDLSKNMPVMAVKKLSGDFVTRFGKRNSGFTRITKLGMRKSDSAKMAVIEFV